MDVNELKALCVERSASYHGSMAAQWRNLCNNQKRSPTATRITLDVQVAYKHQGIKPNR